MFHFLSNFYIHKHFKGLRVSHLLSFCVWWRSHHTLSCQILYVRLWQLRHNRTRYGRQRKFAEIVCCIYGCHHFCCLSESFANDRLHRQSNIILVRRYFHSIGSCGLIVVVPDNLSLSFNQGNCRISKSSIEPWIRWT